MPRHDVKLFLQTKEIRLKYKIRGRRIFQHAYFEGGLEGLRKLRNRLKHFHEKRALQFAWVSIKTPRGNWIPMQMAGWGIQTVDQWIKRCEELEQAEK
jgi:hypothetical protein